MTTRIRLTVLAICSAATACVYVAVNTRPGVHLMLDVLSELGSVEEPQTAASDAPLRLSASLLPIDRVQLPESIEQPSGIKHRNDAVYISTDQTEIFRLDTDFTNVSDRVYLLGGPLLWKQGSLEGIEVRGNQLVGVGEFGTLPTWTEEHGRRWVRGEDVELPDQLADVEFSGVVNTPTGRFATSEDHLAIFNLDDGSEHAINFGDFLNDQGDPAGLMLSGIAHADGYFYILSESHTSILAVEDTLFQLQHVFGIEPCAAADLSVHQGKCFVVIDHNYDQPVPPVLVYDIESAMRAAKETDPGG